MASSVRFDLKVAGLNEIMKSDEMQAHLESAGAAVAAAAGEGYESRVHTASFVSIANVYPATKKAAADLYKNNSLEKALRSVGLNATK